MWLVAATVSKSIPILSIGQFATMPILVFRVLGFRVYVEPPLWQFLLLLDICWGPFRGIYFLDPPRGLTIEAVCNPRAEFRFQGAPSLLKNHTFCLPWHLETVPLFPLSLCKCVIKNERQLLEAFWSAGIPHPHVMGITNGMASCRCDSQH